MIEQFIQETTTDDGNIQIAYNVVKRTPHKGYETVTLIRADHNGRSGKFIRKVHVIDGREWVSLSLKQVASRKIN